MLLQRGLNGAKPLAPLTPSGHPTFGVYPSCFGMFIPRGFPIAPWNPSAVALQARLCVLQGKIITLHSLTPSKRMRPKGCRGRPESPLRNTPSSSEGNPKESRGRRSSPLENLTLETSFKGMHPKGCRGRPESPLRNTTSSSEGNPKESRGRRSSPLEYGSKSFCKGTQTLHAFRYLCR